MIVAKQPAKSAWGVQISLHGTPNPDQSVPASPLSQAFRATCSASPPGGLVAVKGAHDSALHPRWGCKPRLPLCVMG